MRGFDGELTLMGERGWVLRNEIGLPVGAGQELYAGADWAMRAGPSTRWLQGRNLAGAVIGARRRQGLPVGSLRRRAAGQARASRPPP